MVVCIGERSESGRVAPMKHKLLHPSQDKGLLCLAQPKWLRHWSPDLHGTPKPSSERFPWKQANPPDNKVLHSVPIRHTRSLRVHNRPIPISSKTWLTLPILSALYTSHQENLAPTEPHNVTGPGTHHLPFITLLTPGACFQSCFQVLLALSGLYTSHQENLAFTQPHNVIGPGHNQLFFFFSFLCQAASGLLWKWPLLAMSGHTLSAPTSHQQNLAITETHNVTGTWNILNIIILGQGLLWKCENHFHSTPTWKHCLYLAPTDGTRSQALRSVTLLNSLCCHLRPAFKVTSKSLISE